MDFNVACLQIGLIGNQNRLRDHIVGQAQIAADAGADLLVIPKYPTTSQPNDYSRAYRDDAPSGALALAGRLARSTGMWIVLGGVTVKRSDRTSVTRGYVVHPNGALVAAFGDVESDQPLSDQIGSQLLSPLIVSDMPWCRFGFGVTSEEALAKSVTALAAEGALCQFLTVRLDVDGPDNTDWLGTIRRQASVNGTYVIASTAIHQKNCGSIGRTIVVNPSGQELACEIAANSIIIVRVDGSEALRVRKNRFVSKPNVHVKAVRQWIWPTAFDYM